jgi:hypothetical protein
LKDKVSSSSEETNKGGGIVSEVNLLSEVEEDK